MEGGYNDFWARKMKKVFDALDIVKNGYLTLEAMEAGAAGTGGCLAKYPQMKKETLLALRQHTWKVLYNKGQDIPPGFRLTFQEFLDNMWFSVNQPNFKEEIAAMSKDSYQQMYRDIDDRVTKEEYLKLNSFRAGEDVAMAIFEAMDSDHDGAVDFQELVNAKYFYYTDLTHESHPFNLMNGPLD